MINENKIRKAIRKHLFENMNEISECGQKMVDEDFLEEERLTNEEGREKVKNKENFIASHCWGERLGESGDFVTCSYGKQYPLFIFDSTKDRWYENGDQYIYEGEPVEQTEEHRSTLKPSIDMHTKTLDFMLSKLHSLMKKNGISELSHVSVEPGTKN
jgi:hypothetical protein